MAPHSSMHEHGETVRSAYRQRIDALEAAGQERAEAEAEERESSSVQSVDTELAEESKFVANPEVRKEVTSEEEFSEGLTGEDDDLEQVQTPDPGTPEGEGDDTPEDDGDLPKESWKRDDIVQYLVDHDVIESAEDVDGQTKAELIDNFVDSKG